MDDTPFAQTEYAATAHAYDTMWLGHSIKLISGS
jgi:hypothetical protein